VEPRVVSPAAPVTAEPESEAPTNIDEACR